MTHPDRAIEAGARVCYEKFNEGLIRDLEIEWPDMPQDFKERMIEAFSAGVTALAAEGLVLMPIEPTSSIIKAYIAADPRRKRYAATARRDYRAMLAAAQEQNDASK